MAEVHADRTWAQVFTRIGESIIDSLHDGIESGELIVMENTSGKR
jgi:hypothetical protein